VNRLITMRTRHRQADRRTHGQTDIMAIARRFVLTNASRAETSGPKCWEPERCRASNRNYCVGSGSARELWIDAL